MGKMAASWDFVKTSFSTIASDKELILLPMTSALISALAMVALFGWYFAAFWPEIRVAHAVGSRARLPHTPTLYVLMFIFYVINYFVVIFCNVALVAVANNRMGGGCWKMRDGLDLARDRSFTIFQWAVLAATVGMILRIISERVGILGRIVTGFIGLAWTLATYFIVPVLAFENLSPTEALKRSAQLFRKTWGENVVAGLSFSLIFAVPLGGGIILWYFVFIAVSASAAAMIASVVVLVIYIQVISAVASAAASVFNVALYNYALSGRLHGGFSEDQFQSAWVPKN